MKRIQIHLQQMIATSSRLARRYAIPVSICLIVLSLIALLSTMLFRYQLKQRLQPAGETIAKYTWIPPTIISLPSTATPTGDTAKVKVESSAKTSLLVPFVYGVIGAYQANTTNVHMEDIYALWSGQSPQAPLPFYKEVYLSPEVKADLQRLWHTPPNDKHIHIVTSSEVLAKVQAEKNSIGILPLDQVVASTQLFTVDGHDPLQPEDAAFSTYPLTVYHNQEKGTHLNISVDKLTSLTMSGAMNLWPAAARQMANKDSQKAKEITANLEEGIPFTGADFVVLHNSVPLDPHCTMGAVKRPETPSQRQCALPPDYCRALAALSPTAININGAYSLDLGMGGLLYTINYYRQSGWKSFGGGRNIEEAETPLLLSKHGNQIALFAINAAPAAAKMAASPGRGGIAPVDMQRLARQIQQLRRQAVPPTIIIAVHGTTTKQPIATKKQVAFYHRLSQLGADVVIGVQGDIPQNGEINTADHRIIFFGLGNLLAPPPPTGSKNQTNDSRRSWVVTFYIYDHHLLAFRLHATIRDAKKGTLYWARGYADIIDVQKAYKSKDQPDGPTLWKSFVKALITTRQ